MSFGYAALRPLPFAATVTAAVVVGLAVGSFLNVVVYRVPRGISVSDPRRSFCPVCGTTLGALDNVPLLSWLVLRGKCRSCGAAISPRYPLVEASVAVVFAGLAVDVGSRWALPGLCVLAAGLAALAAIELDGAGRAGGVAPISAVLGGAMLTGAAVAGHLWAHLVGMAAGLVLAPLSALAARRWRRGADIRLGDPLPALALLGWTGPVGGSIGLAVSALLWLTLGRLSVRRSTHLAVSTAVGCAVAVAAARGWGAHLGA